MFNKSGLTAMQNGKLEKALSKQYNFSEGGVMTLEEYIQKRKWVYKKYEVQIYSRKEICMDHPLLEKPKYDYMIWDTQGIGLTVPKMVYDALDLEDRTDKDFAQRQLEEFAKEYAKNNRRYSSSISRW